jgi:hypothetical protein
MAEASGTNDDVEARLPSDVQRLAEAIDALPEEHRTALTPVVSHVLQNTQRRRRILNLVQEAIGQLRLDMKYLVFDLEATRRERDEFQRRLDQEGTA